MSPYHWLLSFLLVFHISALAIDAIPAPRELTAPREVNSSPGRGVVGNLTLALDSVAVDLARADSVLFRWSQPLRRFTQLYINLGLYQRWLMFTAPVTQDQYIRIDLYTTASSGELVRIQKLVLPTSREDRVRLLHDFQDKATVGLWTAFNDANASKSPDAPGHDDMTLFVRFFKTDFRNQYLSSEDRIVRTEVWFGSAPILPPGGARTEDLVRERLSALPSYYGAGRRTPFHSTYQYLGSQQREADITWTLAYFENL